MTSKELAASLVRSLFCGLPRLEKRLAIFVCGSDETEIGGHRGTFAHAGLLASAPDWWDFFAPAWQERVLDAPPKIPYLHVIELRDPEWQQQHGITSAQAEDKLDEAVNLINTMGSFRFLGVKADAGLFLDLFGKKKIVQKGLSNKAQRFLIDHFCFNSYTFAVLGYVARHYPDAERVDFIVSRKDGVSDKLNEYYDVLGASLEKIGRGELCRLRGDFITAGIDRVPLQAADVVCWHMQRSYGERITDRDARRLAILAPLRTMMAPIDTGVLRALAAAFMEKLDEQRVSELRQHDAEINQRPSRQAKSRAGRRKAGKGRKEKKAEV